MKIVNFDNVSVSYGAQRVLSGVNLEIHSDDFMAVIGPNGGGKSSLIKALLGLVPHDGEISFDDSLRGDRGQLSIGYMPQVSLFDRAFPITIEEVVMSGIVAHTALLRRSRYTKEQIERGRRLMERTSILQIAKRGIGELSGGQLQRALLCRAVISAPKLLILDEPTNFVDNQFEGELYGLLTELSSEMAIVMISHDIGSVSAVVKQIVCVNGTVHRHDSNIITNEQLANYNCPIQVISHGAIPHTVLSFHGDK
ncbi:MAG: ABC transporter ATP-binding protein [Rikenellaceae bacterium]